MVIEGDRLSKFIQVTTRGKAYYSCAALFQTIGVVIYTSKEMGHNGTIASLFVNSAVLYKMFSALHGMPARTSYEKGVCLSVCLSAVIRVDCDKTEETSVHTKDHLA